MAPVNSGRVQSPEVMETRENRHKMRGDERKLLKHTWSDADSRSISPSPSVKSFHSARSAFSAHSEVGDSGVSSERDSPSPRGSPSLNSSIGPSESENDSCGSSESLHRFSADGQTNAMKVAHNPVTDIPKLPPKSRKRLPPHLYRPKPSVPTILLKQICEQARQFEKRRQRTAKIDTSSTNMMRSLSIRSRPMTHTRMTHTSHMSSQPASLISTAVLFPSTPSLILEEDEGDDERSLGVHSSLSCDDASSTSSSVHSSSVGGLYEHAERDAGVAFAGIKTIFSPPQLSTLRSQKGTVRGVRNRVRAGIATFTSDQSLLKLYTERERGRVVMFVTSLGIVRHTYERCQSIRKILWNLMVQFEERDVFMNRDTQLQLLDRLNSKIVSLPHIFIEGQYLGGADLIEQLNETGELRRLLQPYRVQSPHPSPCDACGGYRMLPCPVCCGSKKSLNRNHFTLEFVALKCCCCDESGLVPCSECTQNT